MPLVTDHAYPHSQPCQTNVIDRESNKMDQWIKEVIYYTSDKNKKTSR